MRFAIYKGDLSADRVLTPRRGYDAFAWKKGVETSRAHNPRSWTAEIGDQLALFAGDDANVGALAEVVAIERGGWALRVRKLCGALMLPCEVDVVRVKTGRAA